MIAFFLDVTAVLVALWVYDKIADWKIKRRYYH